MGKTRKKQQKGFAVMDPKKQREIASMGGKRSHQLGVAHTFTTEEARAAGKKGGKRRRRTAGKAK
jgi:general stress protein YciG